MVNKNIILKIALLILAVEAVVEIYLLANSNPAIKRAIVLATTHQPERFTELYFEDHLNLPKTIELGKEQAFKFTIHNLEYQNMAYKYEVKAVDDNQNLTIASGSATLAQDEYKTIDESYTLATASGRMKIQVLLMNQNQPIDFWLEKP